MSESKTWYKHSIFCTTESSWKTAITETETLLVACPSNNTHTVNITGAYIIDSLSENKVSVDQVSMGGFFTNHGRSFIAEGCATGSENIGLTTIDNFDLEMPISLLNGKFDAKAGMEDDVINLRLVPKTDSIIGIITATGALDATTLTVYSSVFPLLQMEGSGIYLTCSLTGRESEKSLITNSVALGGGVGTVTLKTPLGIDDGISFNPNTTYVHCLHNGLATITTGHPVYTYSRWIYLTTPILSYFRSSRWIRIFRDGNNYSELRMISKLDMNNSRVKINTPFNIALDLNNGPVYVQLFMKISHNRELQDNTQIRLGENIIGGTYQPENVGVIAEYTRKRTTPIKVVYNFEMFA